MINNVIQLTNIKVMKHEPQQEQETDNFESARTLVRKALAEDNISLKKSILEAQYDPEFRSSLDYSTRELLDSIYNRDGEAALLKRLPDANEYAFLQNLKNTGSMSLLELEKNKLEHNISDHRFNQFAREGLVNKEAFEYGDLIMALKEANVDSGSFLDVTVQSGFKEVDLIRARNAGVIDYCTDEEVKFMQNIEKKNFKNELELHLLSEKKGLSTESYNYLKNAKYIKTYFEERKILERSKDIEDFKYKLAEARANGQRLEDYNKLVKNIDFEKMKLKSIVSTGNSCRVRESNFVRYDESANLLALKDWSNIGRVSLNSSDARLLVKSEGEMSRYEASRYKLLLEGKSFKTNNKSLVTELYYNVSRINNPSIQRNVIELADRVGIYNGTELAAILKAKHIANDILNTSNDISEQFEKFHRAKTKEGRDQAQIKIKIKAGKLSLRYGTNTKERVNNFFKRNEMDVDLFKASLISDIEAKARKSFNMELIRAGLSPGHLKDNDGFCLVFSKDFSKSLKFLENHEQNMPFWHRNIRSSNSDIEYIKTLLEGKSITFKDAMELLSKEYKYDKEFLESLKLHERRDISFPTLTSNRAIRNIVDQIKDNIEVSLEEFELLNEVTNTDSLKDAKELIDKALLPPLRKKFLKNFVSYEYGNVKDYYINIDRDTVGFSSCTLPFSISPEFCEQITGQRSREQSVISREDMNNYLLAVRKGFDDVTAKCRESFVIAELLTSSDNLKNMYIPTTRELDFMDGVSGRYITLKTLHKIGLDDYGLKPKAVENLMNIYNVDFEKESQQKHVYFNNHENIATSEMRANPLTFKKDQRDTSKFRALSYIEAKYFDTILNDDKVEKHRIEKNDVRLYYKIRNGHRLNFSESLRNNYLIRNSIGYKSEHSRDIMKGSTGNFEMKKMAKVLRTNSFLKENVIDIGALLFVNKFKQVTGEQLQRYGMSEEDIEAYTQGIKTEDESLYGSPRLLKKDYLPHKSGRICYYSIQHEGEMSGRKILEKFIPDPDRYIAKKTQGRKDLLYHDLKVVSSVQKVVEILKDEHGDKLNIKRIVNEASIMREAKLNKLPKQMQENTSFMDARIDIELSNAVSRSSGSGSKIIAVEYGNYTLERMAEKIENCSFDHAYIFSNAAHNQIYINNLSHYQNVTFLTL